MAVVDRPPDDYDRAALASLGIDLDRVREAAEAVFGEGALTGTGVRRRRRPRLTAWSRRRDRPAGYLSGRRAFDAPARKALELSLREALRLGHRFIGAEHIALGLLRGDDRVIRALLAGGEVSGSQVRASLEVALRSVA
jgi:hypothetical protein